MTFQLFHIDNITWMGLCMQKSCKWWERRWCLDVHLTWLAKCQVKPLRVYQQFVTSCKKMTDLEREKTFWSSGDICDLSASRWLWVHSQERVVKYSRISIDLCSFAYILTILTQHSNSAHRSLYNIDEKSIGLHATIENGGQWHCDVIATSSSST